MSIGSRIAGLACGVLVLAAVLGPILAGQNPYDPTAVNLMNGFTPPGQANPVTGQMFVLGADDQGRDLALAILYGLRMSLGVSGAAVLLAVLLGGLLGALAGFRGGWLDGVIMRAADIQLSFPAILVAMLIFGVGQALVPSAARADLAVWVLILSIGLSDWVTFARLVRSGVRAERDKPYVQAARLAGRSGAMILLRHILPTLTAPVLVVGTASLALAVIAEATLSFLGAGLPPTHPSLGTLIRVGQGFMFSGEWWILVFPAATLLILALSVNVLGDWLSDRLDPRGRWQR